MVARLKPRLNQPKNSAFLVLVTLRDRLEQRRAERRRQRHRQEHREQHGRHERQRKLPVDVSHGSAEERHGDEHGGKHERDADQRRGDLTHRLARGFERRQPFFRHDSFDVFHHDNGVINQNADGQDHAEHRQHVDGKSEGEHRTECPQQSHGDHDRRDQRRAKVLEEEIHHQEHQENRLQPAFSKLPGSRSGRRRKCSADNPRELRAERTWKAPRPSDGPLRRSSWHWRKVKA